MTLTSIIILVIIISALVGGGFLILNSMLLPRKLEEIEALMNKGRYRDSLPRLNKFLDKDERNTKAQYLLGICHQKLGNFTDAVFSFKQALKSLNFPVDLSEAQIRKQLAKCYLDMGNINEAKNEFLILTTQDPDNFENYYEVGRLFLDAKHYQRAVNFLTKAAKFNTRHAPSWSLLGQGQFQLKMYQDSKNSLIKAIQLKPELKEPRYYLGLSLRYTGDLEWALKELEMAEKAESVRDKAILAQGMVLIDQSSYSMAISELERGLKIALPGSDTSLDMRYLIALAAEKNRDLQKAVSQWEEIDRIRAGYRDVKEKLAQYSDYRTHDSIKDFIIASVTQFEGISRNIIENLRYQIINLRIVNDNLIQALVSEEDARKTARKMYTMIMIQREVKALTETNVRDFQETMRENHASRGIVMVTADITPAALNFTSSRPIDLYDAGKMASLLDAAMN